MLPVVKALSVFKVLKHFQRYAEEGFVFIGIVSPVGCRQQFPHAARVKRLTHIAIILFATVGIAEGYLGF